VIDIQ